VTTSWRLRAEHRTAFGMPASRAPAITSSRRAAPSRRRRFLALAGAASAVSCGWGALYVLSSSAVPSRASSVPCSEPGPPAPACAGHPHLYMARPGDTIWAIAVRFSGRQDPRPLEYRLEAETGGGTLQPGETLRVP
jgi:hypothetical protein